MKTTLLATLLSLAALAHASAPEMEAAASAPAPTPAPAVLFWINPMLGWNNNMVGSVPILAYGLGLNASRGQLMGSVRYISGSEFCIGCSDYEEKKQPSILFGLKQEWPMGFFALMSGLSYENGIKKDNLKDPGGAFPDDYDLVHYQQVGIPIVLDAILSTQTIGYGVTIAANLNRVNPSTSFLFSMHMGKVRGRHSWY